MDDMFVSKYTSDRETIQDVTDKYTMYQGIPQEYPIYYSQGHDFEIITLTPGDDVTSDHYTVHAYVKDVDTQKWEEWRQVDSLYTQSTNSAVFELRLNPQKRYEVKFGNNINGRKLKQGDSVAIYYLKSDGSSGKIGPNIISKTATLFTTPQFIDIWTDIKSSNTSYVDSAAIKNFEF